jgi:hypothetical protein
MSDLIERQAAIDAIHEDADWLASQGSDWQVERMERDKSILRSLPSVQPQAEEDCDTCKHGFFGSRQCDNCRVRYPSHYERKEEQHGPD